jgi:hypothetical protein
VWGLKNPPNNGVQAVSITLDNGEFWRAAAVTYNGVDQTTPTSGAAVNGANGSSASVVVTSASGDLAVGTCSREGSATITADQTAEYQSGVNDALCGEHTNGVGSTTLSWTLGAARDWVTHGFSLHASGGGGGTPGVMWLYS